MEISWSITKNKPIIGEAIFTHESGIHSHGIQKNPLTFQPFLPKDVNIKSHKMMAGKYSGASSIKKLLNDEGISVNTTEAKILAIQVRKRAIEKKKSLSTGELKDIYRKQFGEFYYFKDAPYF